MVRDNANDFTSNPQSIPIQVFQHNGFREGYFKASITIDHGRQEATAGAESDNTFLNENFRYLITDPTQFDGGTPPAFTFAENRPDLEQSVYVQDQLRLRDWTLSAGIRWDHYQLLLNRQAVSPRLSVARYFQTANLVMHFSYDRVFQTPSFENILLSNSSAIQSLAPNNFLRLPVEPSQGDYFEAGLTKVLRKGEAGRQLLSPRGGQLRRRRPDREHHNQLSHRLPQVDHLRRRRQARPGGLEALLGLPELLLHRGQRVVSGGRRAVSGRERQCCGNADHGALSGLAGSAKHDAGTPSLPGCAALWLAGGAQYDSGLPFEFDGDPSTVLDEYGQAVLNRINFSRGRIRPSLLVNASAA